MCHVFGCILLQNLLLFELFDCEGTSAGLEINFFIGRFLSMCQIIAFTYQMLIFVPCFFLYFATKFCSYLNYFTAKAPRVAGPPFLPPPPPLQQGRLQTLQTSSRNCGHRRPFQKVLARLMCYKVTLNAFYPLQ